jgi:hypothetical protein
MIDYPRLKTDHIYALKMAGVPPEINGLAFLGPKGYPKETTLRKLGQIKPDGYHIRLGHVAVCVGCGRNHTYTPCRNYLHILAYNAWKLAKWFKHHDSLPSGKRVEKEKPLESPAFALTERFFPGFRVGLHDTKVKMGSTYKLPDISVHDITTIFGKSDLRALGDVKLPNELRYRTHEEQVESYCKITDCYTGFLTDGSRIRFFDLRTRVWTN